MTVYQKYPRTLHLPYSPGVTNDDRITPQIPQYKEVVITEKMDGENTTIYGDGTFHARSIDSPMTEWRLPIRRRSSLIRSLNAPYVWHGENLYACHSIHYQELEDYFLVFSIREDKTYLSWDETVELASIAGIKLVPVLWRGDYSEIPSIKLRPNQEGYVIRPAESYTDHSMVLKYVRSNHVQTDQHWTKQSIIPNGIRSI